MRSVALVLLLSWASAVLGQAGTVVVTASRFRDARNDLPVGVTVISAAELRSSGAATLQQVLAQYGLLQIRDNAGTPDTQIDLRGFGVTGDQNTLVLLDGVRLSENELVPAQLSLIPMESIERIEIVRGSGAVLYGGGATAGVINIITRKPEPGSRQAYALGRAGGYGTEELKAGTSRMGERLGFSLDAGQQNSDGYRRNNHFRETNAAGTLRAQGEGGEAYLRFGLDEQALGLPGALTEAQIAADPRQAANPHDRSKRHDAYLVLGGRRRLGRDELAADLSYRKKSAWAFFESSSFFTDSEVEHWSFLPRARLRFDALGRTHDVVVGADLSRWDLDTGSATSPATLGAPFSHRIGEQENSALYGQAELWLTGTTRAVLGARAQRTDETLTETVFPVNERRAAHDLHAYEVALRQALGTGYWAYAKHGTSFRLADFDENACFFPPCSPTLLEPQTATTDEAGLEAERGTWRGRLAVYETRLENEIYFSPLALANVNLPPTLRRGVEVEAAWRLSSTVEMRASAAFLRAKFRDAGTDVPLVPDRLATASLLWRPTARDRLNVDARYVGPQRFDNDQANTFPRLMPAYTLVDLDFEHRLRHVSLGLQVRNLFDRRYFSYGAVNFSGTGFSAYPQPGRAVFVSVAWRLD